MFSRVSLLRSTAPLRLVVSKKSLLRCKSVATTAEATAARDTKASTTTTATSSVPIVTSLLAAAAGVITVSAAAAIVETSTASTVPPFDPVSQRFDQTGYKGRFFRMILQCDPRLLLYSQDQARRAKAFCDSRVGDDRALWEARRLWESALNDAGDVVPRPFRMSGFVPFNGPICVAMVASPSTAPLLFWSWVNQSQNALVNYYNRSAASTMTNETLAKSYVIAVGSALAVAFGLATLIQKRYPPAQAKSLLRYVAFPSAVVASSLNCYIVRSPEIKSGIPLLNSAAAGEDVLVGETSHVAAAAGVYSTTASRALLQAPVYFLPPVLVTTVPLFRRLLVKSPSLCVPLTTYLLLVSFGVGLPATVAVFPQISEIAADKVEERFQHLRDPETGKPYERFYFNKGL